MKLAPALEKGRGLAIGRGVLACRAKDPAVDLVVVDLHKANMEAEAVPWQRFGEHGLEHDEWEPARNITT